MVTVACLNHFSYGECLGLAYTSNKKRKASWVNSGLLHRELQDDFCDFFYHSHFAETQCREREKARDHKSRKPVSTLWLTDCKTWRQTVSNPHGLAGSSLNTMDSTQQRCKN